MKILKYLDWINELKSSNIEPFKYKVVVVVGLPGSGKSTFSEKYIKKHPEFVVYDDFELHKALDSIGKENMLISDGRIIDDTKKYINQIKSFCNERYSDMEVFYFENDPEKCKLNMINRWNLMDDNEREKNPHKNPSVLLSEIRYYSRKYDIPKGSKILKINYPNDNMI